MHLALEAELSVLFQITVMLLMPVLLVASFARALQHGPGLFSERAIALWFDAQRIPEIAWVGSAALWYAWTLPTFDHDGQAGSFALALGGVLLATGVGLVWIHRCVRRLLARGDLALVMPVGAQECFTPRDRAGGRAIPGAARIARVSAVLALALVVLALALALTIVLGAADVVRVLVQLVVLAAHWMALRVLLMDLVLDTWPPLAGVERLRRTAVYYVQVFEQWVVRSVLLVLLLVMVLAPLASVAGYVPPVASAFALWALGGMLFAAAWNRNDAARSPLPLPMRVNRYSAHDARWAWFVTIVHAGMAVCLMVALATLNR